MNWREITDTVLEVPIVTSFTRIGYEARKRLEDWTPLDSYDMTGKVVVLTGATSGLGRAAAERFAAAGATLIVVGRTAERNEAVVRELERDERRRVDLADRRRHG